MMRETLNTDAKNFNIYSFNACQIAYNKGTIGMIVTRQMTMGSDGLNHQDGYAAIFDSKTLKIIKAFGQTSGHSFMHSLIPNTVKKEGFLGMDLGDCYPRGINHWKFNYDKLTRKTVYSFKTLHAK